MGLALILLGADGALASPFYAVKDLGVYSSVQAQGSQLRIDVDSQGNVSLAPNGGLNFGSSASGPVPAGDQSYYSVSKGSDNGLYTAGRAYDPAAHHFDGYTVSGGKATPLNPIDPSAPDSTIAPYAVNNAGQVVGGATWINESGEMVSGPAISTTGQGSQMIATTGGFAYGINNLGQVVGEFIPQPQTSSQTHAFLWDGAGKLYDLNTLIAAGSGWTLKTATGINDKGQIAGYAMDGSGQYHALLLTPTDPSTPSPSGPPSPPPPTPAPEPGTLAFVGLVVLGLAARRAWGR
jgi:probable HAF family extracellular repeat protein